MAEKALRWAAAPKTDCDTFLAANIMTERERWRDGGDRSDVGDVQRMFNDRRIFGRKLWPLAVQRPRRAQALLNRAWRVASPHPSPCTSHVPHLAGLQSPLERPHLDPFRPLVRERHISKQSQESSPKRIVTHSTATLHTIDRDVEVTDYMYLLTEHHHQCIEMRAGGTL